MGCGCGWTGILWTDCTLHTTHRTLHIRTPALTPRIFVRNRSSALRLKDIRFSPSHCAACFLNCAFGQEDARNFIVVELGRWISCLCSDCHYRMISLSASPKCKTGSLFADFPDFWIRAGWKFPGGFQQAVINLACA